MFSQATIEAIGSYVYVLTDGEDKIFYIGKGEGNRVFDHVAEVRIILQNSARDSLFDEDEDEAAIPSAGMSSKKSVIANMLERGEEPRMYIVRENLSSEEALLLEATLISVLEWQLAGGLTNLVAGHGTSRFGLKTVYELEATKGEPFDLLCLPGVQPGDEVLAINVNRRWAEVADGSSSLLEISKGSWKLNPNRAKDCKFVVVHANGIVRGVFEVSAWGAPDEARRISFTAVGHAPLRGPAFSQKNASSLFGSKGVGSQNPIRYVKV